MCIGGRSVAARDGRTIPVIDPSTGESFDSISAGGTHEVDLAVAAARHALDGPWGAQSATDRGRTLSRLAERVRAEAESLAVLEARDTGKAMSTARNDIQVLARYFEFFGGAADKVLGQVIPYVPGHHVTLEREPLGVTAHILPWNYPAQMLGRTVAPALAMGNAVVLKPAEDTSLSALRVSELALDVGLPEGTFNVVTGYGDEAGAALAGHPGIDFVSFTGSLEVGRLVQAAAARNVVRCVLELGGKSPQIVFSDADVPRAVTTIVRALVQNAGQTCTAGSRLLIERGVYAEVLARVGAAFAALRAGTPAMDLDCGPLMNAAQHARVNGYLEAAAASNIRVFARGRVEEGCPPGGYFVAPTLLGDVPRDHAIAREEIFGPVLAAMPFEDEADAISLGNATDYGLTAGVWSENAGRLARVAKRLRAGQVVLNCYGAGGGVEVPFGGTKRSGYGREKGLLALEELSTTKAIVHFHG